MKNLILAIKTDQPTAELHLLKGSKELGKEIWPAGRELSGTILQKIVALLKANNQKLEDISGVVVFAGPGTFTSLRIGVVVANTLAYSLNVAVIGTNGANWLEEGTKKLATTKPGRYVVPAYGQEPNITKPK